MKAKLAAVVGLTAVATILGTGIASADHPPTGPKLPGGNALGPYNYNDQFASVLDPTQWFSGKLLVLSPYGADARVECYYYRDSVASCQQYAPDGSVHYLDPTAAFGLPVFVYQNHP